MGPRAWVQGIGAPERGEAKNIKNCQKSNKFNI